MSDKDIFEILGEEKVDEAFSLSMAKAVINQTKMDLDGVIQRVSKAVSTMKQSDEMRDAAKAMEKIYKELIDIQGKELNAVALKIKK